MRGTPVGGGQKRDERKRAFAVWRIEYGSFDARGTEVRQTTDQESESTDVEGGPRRGGSGAHSRCW
jgi:hypothetical protein